MHEFSKAEIEISKFCRFNMEVKQALSIRPSEMSVLNIITNAPGPHTPHKIAELMNVSKPMVAALISSLLANEYIIKQQASDDKRSFFIIPTQKAKDLVIVAGKEYNKIMQLLVENLGREDFSKFVELLGSTNQILTEKYKK